MKREEAHLQRKLLAEDKWAATLKHMRLPTIFNKLRDLFTNNHKHTSGPLRARSSVFPERFAS
jgi:hypothetical protein